MVECLEMKAEHIETEAILAKHRLRENPADGRNDLAPAIAMRNACDALDKGEVGVRAINELFAIWKEAKLGELTSEAISDLRAIVDQTHELIRKDYDEKSAE